MNLRARLREGPAVWAAAAAAAVAWLALFPLLWPPAPRPRPVPPAPVRPVVFLPAPAAGPASPDGRADSRTVWSPVLFSLPSAAGFSRAPSHAGELKPPLDLPEDRLPVLEREVVPVTNLPTVLSATRTPEPPRPGARAAVPAEPPLPPPPSVEKIAGVAELPPDATLPIPADRRGTKAWEAEAVVEFDASGLVRHVFVEQSDAGPALTAELARGLYRWRLAPGGPAGELRVRFRHEPRPAAPAAGGRP